MRSRAVSQLLTEDFALTAKFWDTLSCSAYTEPERNLMLAILKDALLNYRKHCHRREENFHEARQWLFDQGMDYIFSFEHICAVLGLNPSQIRRNLLKLHLYENLDPALAEPNGKSTGVR